MRFIKTYTRVLLLLGVDLKVAVFLGLANMAVATLHFIDPVLFGRVIELLGHAADLPRGELWHQAGSLLGMWAAVGIGGIAANGAVALQAERLAHRNRLRVMNQYYSHVLSLPLSFYGDTQSGRLMKAMIAGSESLFGVWLTFFRDHLATILSVIVLLPMTLFINWKLASVLIVLVVVFVIVTALVIVRTEDGQRKAEQFNSALSGTAQDALSNVMVVQAFTRLTAETRLFNDIANEFIRHQFPVLNWWALVSVLTRASSSVAVIVIVAVGTLLHVQGEASVGEIVSFMGIATLLIGRLESAVAFTATLFSRLPALEEFFAILDAQSSVPE